MKTVRIGVIGAGHLGRIHARLLAGIEGVELVGVADPVQAARQAVAAENKISETADFRDLIPHIDAAVVATPTQFHHSVAMELVEHGIHLLVEKPITSTVAEAKDLVRAARWQNVVLQVGHIERFNPALTPLLTHLAKPRYIEAVRQGPYSFRSTDISVVLDLMIHDLDIALWLTGGTVSQVAAIGWTVMGGQDDFAQARIEFADGCVANLTASRVSHRPRRQMQLWTADAQIEIDFNTRKSTIVETGGNFDRRLIASQPPPTPGQPLPADRRFESLLPLREVEAGPQNALLEEQRDFVECIRSGREPRVTGEAGLAAIETAHRVLAKIAANTREHARFAVPAVADPIESAILRGPHWDHLPQQPPLRRKEAG